MNLLHATMRDHAAAVDQVTPTRWYRGCAFCPMPRQRHDPLCVWQTLLGRAEGAWWCANWYDIERRVNEEWMRRLHDGSTGPMFGL